MRFDKLTTNPSASSRAKRVEDTANGMLRRLDAVLGVLHLGGRRAPYDDTVYEFHGGSGDVLRKKHYDKSLRLLWKAEQHAPYLGFQDGNPHEKQMRAVALNSLNRSEAVAFERMGTSEFRAMLNREYTLPQKQAIVSLLSMVAHGEAYAWMVSTELLAEAKSTGARAALTMQVFEEAKHFLVLRELLRAFDVPLPRLLAPEYIVLEKVLKARGTEKMFGMNVVVETLALAIIGVVSDLPGLEILRFFHLDESRHTALPSNYFKEFPLSAFQSRNPILQVQRLGMLLPFLLLIPLLEEPLAELGVDACDFGGSSARKILRLSARNGFRLPVPEKTLLEWIDSILNLYCSAVRKNHVPRCFTNQETTRGDLELESEAKIFQPVARI